MKAINIKWDTDGDMELLKDLPIEIKIPVLIESCPYQRKEINIWKNILIEL